jgi:diacylglycerol kinase family enzyme
VAPKASLKDGLIDVTIIHPIKLIHALSMPLQILGYSFDKNPDVECFQSKKIELTGSGIVQLQIDGEPFGGNNVIVIEILKHSLIVLK